MNPLWELLAREIEAFRAQIGELPALPAPEGGEIAGRLTRDYSFEAPVPLDHAVEEVSAWLRDGTVHVTHPRYFGLFNPGVRTASIVADALTALYNPQVGLWSHAPAANSIEQHTLGFLMRRFGLDPATGAAHFTTGGSEANLTALLAALAHTFPGFAQDGLRGLARSPVFYVSEEAHHSFEKNARVTGLGRESIHVIAVDGALRMDVDALRARIATDRQAGEAPFMIVGTAGTTSAGIIDPLETLGAIAREEGLWYHVDAAWGGAAIMSPRLRPHLRGIASADSITCDAHKWFSVSMGAGMFFTRHRDPLQQVFGIDAPYVLGKLRGGDDPYMTTLQWSRRFIGLKLFLTLAELGEAGMARQIEGQADIGDRLRELLLEGGWVVVGDTPLPLVCFTHAQLRGRPELFASVLEGVYAGGRAWISQANLRGKEPVLRACITSFQTSEDDLRILLAELETALEEVAPG